MGVNRFGLRGLLMPEMNQGTPVCSDSSMSEGRKAAQASETAGEIPAVVQKPSLHAPYNGVGSITHYRVDQPTDIDSVQLNHKMRLKLGQEDLSGFVGADPYPPNFTGSGSSVSLLLKSGANHELSMSLPNLTAALDTEQQNGVNERHVRNSLSNIFDGKQDAQSSLSELSKCIKTLSSEDFHTCTEASNAVCIPGNDTPQNGATTRVKGEDIKIEMNGGNNRLSAVLENIPLLYIPHTKQLVTVAPNQGNGKVDSQKPASPTHSTPNTTKVPQTPNSTPNGHGPVTPELLPSPSRGAPLENGHTSKSSPLSGDALLSGTSPIPSSQSNSMLESSLNDSQTNLLNCSEADSTFALSQDSDASSTCRSEHTVIHQDDYIGGAAAMLTSSSQGRKDSWTVDFSPDSGAPDDLASNQESNFSKVSLDRDDSPRSTIQRTNTIGSLSKADASSFSSISSISTATDFSQSAASCSDDYLELRTCGDMDEQGFMEVNLHSRNTYERSRNSSQDSGIDEKQCMGAKPKRRGISSFFARNLFSRKATTNNNNKDSSSSSSSSVTSRDPSSGGSSGSSSSNSSSCSTSAPGWRLFGRVPPKQGPPARDSTDSTKEYQHVKSKPQQQQHQQQHQQQQQQQHQPTPRGKLRPDVEAPSTTALILENRPRNLPSKDPEEEQRHRLEYEAMIEASKKREQREAKLRKKQQQQQLKQEEALAAALRVWNNDILPNWETSKNSKKARDLWWHGIPPAVRGKVWQLAIGNELNLTPELYEICLNRAKDRLKLMQDAGDSDSICSQMSEPSSSKEGSVEVIKLDVSRTFPQLCIFQKGGPYYELLQGLLGAYACYRPDVGYVQGMSFIAAVLLLNMEVADAFICFANLLNRPCQIAFFRLDESLMKSYFLTYEEFFKENLPRLHAVFQKQDLTPDLYIIDWMFTLYAKSLPFDVASRVWDVFCRDGEEFLFRTALGILKMYEDILLSLDFIHLAQFLTKLPENIVADTLFKAIDSINMTVDKKRFAQVLATHREQPKETS